MLTVHIPFYRCRYSQDLLFDAASVYDLSRFQIHIVEAPLPDAPSPPATNMSTTHGPEEKRLIDGAWIRGGRSQAIASGAWSAAHSDSLSDGYDLLPRI